MFSKSFFMFGLLALLACQGVSATKIDLATRATLPELIDQVKEIIASLNELVTGPIGDALATLGNLIQTVVQLKQKILNEGIAAITGGIGNVVQFIKDKTQQAAELGIDITKCIVDRTQQLKKLASDLTNELTNCVTEPISSVLTLINNDIKIVNNIVANITAIPVKLTKCLVSLRPISCVETLLTDVANMLKNLPSQIAGIVEEAKKLVEDLPTQLVACVTNIATTTASSTGAIISEIDSCVDEIISGSKTQLAQRSAITDLIAEIKEVISSLNNLVTGTITQALSTLANLTKVILEAKVKFLKDGIASIQGGIGNVIQFIKDKTQEAAELGVDISKCIIGREAQLEQLAKDLTNDLTKCVTTNVNSVLTMINNEIKLIEKMATDIASIPLLLSKCITNLKPLTCLENLLTNVTTLLKNLPEQILAMVNEAKILAEDLPVQLLECVENISTSTATQTQAIIKEIGSCADEAISGGSA